MHLKAKERCAAFLQIFEYYSSQVSEYIRITKSSTQRMNLEKLEEHCCIIDSLINGWGVGRENYLSCLQYLIRMTSDGNPRILTVLAKMDHLIVL